MDPSERIRWLSDISKSSDSVPPCAYDVAIQLAMCANSETDLAWPGLTSKVGRNGAKRGAKWLRDHGWIVPQEIPKGRAAVYKLVSAVTRDQFCTGINPDPGDGSNLSRGMDQPRPGGGVSSEPLTGKEQVKNREGTGDSPFDDTPPEPPPSDYGHHLAKTDAKYQPEVLSALRSAGCKMGKSDRLLPEWVSLVEQHGLEAVCDAASQVGPVDRWPDRIAQAIWDKANTCPYPAGSDQAINWYVMHDALGKLQ